MIIDYSRTLKAYLGFEGKMEELTRSVHEYVLSDKYLGRPGKCKQILKGAQKIEDDNKECLVNTYAGKLCFKIPALHLVDRQFPFEKERARLIAAGIIMNVFIDNGTYDIREEVKRDEPHKDGRERKFRKHIYIMLGGKSVFDLYKGIHLEPGIVLQSNIGGWELTAEMHQFLADGASVPYKIWDGCTTELLMHMYSLKTDWGKKVDKNGRKLSEDPICKTRRFELYADKIINHVKRFPLFYLSMKYCDRNRAYYDASTLEGIRPHGKECETLMLDSAIPFTLTEEDERILKHIIYVNIHGRATIAKAVKKFGLGDLFFAEAVDPLQTTTQKELGTAIKLNKAAQALYDYKNGVQSTFMFGYDFTNSGLMMAGNCFHSKEMMKSANLGGLKTVFDSHTEFGVAYGLDLPRDEVKKLHTALLHGSTAEGIQKAIAAIYIKEGKEGVITTRMVEDANEKAYGSCIRNIDAIAEWGTIAVGNRQCVLRWTMPDGFKAASRAHLVGVPVRIYCASARHKEGYCSYTVVKDMPLVEDKNGFPIYDKNTELDGVHYPVKVKKRGLFANITHSIDAYVLRCVVSALRKAKRPFLLKHDDYIVPPGAQAIVLKASQDAFRLLYDHNVYQNAMEEIARYSPYGLEVPKLLMGKARNTAAVSENYLMP